MPHRDRWGDPDCAECEVTTAAENSPTGVPEKSNPAPGCQPKPVRPESRRTRPIHMTTPTGRRSTGRLRLAPERCAFVHIDAMNLRFSNDGPEPSPRIARLSAAIRILVATVVPAVIVTATSPAAASPGWVAPLDSVDLLSEFSPPAQRWLAGHRGVDLTARPGQTVMAAGSGRVSFVGDIAGRGVVTVTHGDLRTTYEPVVATVAPGQTISRGQSIGVIGSGGHCDVRCLHWGLVNGDDYLDPMLLLSTEPPVLKVPNTARTAANTRPAAGSINRSTGSVDPPSVAVSGRQPARPEVPGKSAVNSTAPAIREAAASRSAPRDEAPGALIGVGAMASAGVLGAAIVRRRRRVPTRSPT